MIAPDDAIKECLKIIELWREGYTDGEIRDKLELSPHEFINRIQRIKRDDLVATEAMMLFEKESIKLSDLYRNARLRLDDCDPRLAPSLIKTLVDIVKTRIDIAQKLNAVDPQRFVVDIVKQEEEDLSRMSDKELGEYFFEQFNKHSH